MCVCGGGGGGGYNLEFSFFGGSGVGADVAILGYCHLQVCFFFYVIFRSLSKLTIFGIYQNSRYFLVL